MNNKFIIISFDAIDSNDFKNILQLPHFKELIEKGSYSSQVESIFPSLTYPAHTSIVTGKLPINHGITNNILIQPERETPDWFWHRKYINGTTIYDEAKKKGFRTCSLLWPVTGRAKNIDFNMPEIFANRKWQNQILVSATSGSKMFQLKLNNLFGSLRKGVEQPYLDNFTFKSLMYVLENDLADFIMVHFTDTDSHKHTFGTKSPHIFQSLKRHDARLGEIIKFLKLHDIYDSSTLIALGDHSFKDASYVIKLNKLFLEKDFITVDKNNKIVDYKAYLNFCDGSAYVYVKDQSIVKKVYDLLVKFSLYNNDCIKSILSSAEAKARGASDKCTFMLEAKDDYYFINDFNGSIIEETKGNYDIATHGYNPKDDDYKTLFFCKSPQVKENFNIGPMRLIDEGATIFNLLNAEVPTIDGAPLTQIFKSPLE